MEIEFEVEGNEQPRYEKLRLSADLPYELARTIHYTWRKIGRKYEASAENYLGLWDDRVYEAPTESRLIGIYMCCRKFCCVGTLNRD